MPVMQDPEDTSGRLIAADEVQGTSVYNRAGEKLGSVEDIMIDKVGGKAEYAVVSFGGFLGLGANEYPIPWEKLTYDTRMGGFIVDIDKSMLEGAPVYTEDARWGETEWRRVNQHYSALMPTAAAAGQRR
jgi:sporulation protein YlmC with PRC-barrel domain